MAGLAYSPAPPPKEGHAQRVLGLGLVALLHLLLLLALIHGLVSPVGRAHLVRELTFVIPALPKPAPRVPVGVPSAPMRPAVAPALPRYALPDMPPTTSSPPDVQSFGQSLFGCSPNRRNEMTEEERAHCPSPFHVPDPTALRDPPSEVKDPVRRQAELAAKNTPLRIPCVGVMTKAIGPPGRESSGVTLNPLCLANGLLNGFGRLSGLAH